MYGPRHHGRSRRCLYSLAEWNLNWGRQGHISVSRSQQAALGRPCTMGAYIVCPMTFGVRLGAWRMACAPQFGSAWIS